MKNLITRLLMSAFLICLAFDGYAAGLEIPGQGTRSLARGGAFSARADDPTAGIHNPGALIKGEGLRLTYNHNLIWSFTEFTRSPSQIPETAGVENYPASSQWNEPSKNQTPFFPLNGLLAVDYDFGLKNWAFGLQVYGPNNTGSTKYDPQGGQRYMLTELDALVAYVGLSAAYGTEDYGIGATVQYATMPKLHYSLVVDGATPGAGLSPYASAYDVVSTIRLSDMFAASAILGAWWRPVPQFEVALSGRVAPVKFHATGDVIVENVPVESCPEGEKCGAQFDDGQLQVPGSSAAMDLTLPPTARLGLRYRHLDGADELFDIELDVVYEGWSVIDEYNLDLEGKIKLYGELPVQDITLPKKWRDTVSVRLGGTYAVIPSMLEVSLGGYWEQGATPLNYTHLDFLSVDRMGLGTGLTYKTKRVELTLAYSHVFQDDRTVTETYGKVLQQRPVSQCPDGCNEYSGVPANAGTFKSSVDFVSVGMQANF
jgi:long-subunit fatty acid transport protein